MSMFSMFFLSFVLFSLSASFSLSVINFFLVPLLFLLSYVHFFFPFFLAVSLSLPWVIYQVLTVYLWYAQCIWEEFFIFLGSDQIV